VRNTQCRMACTVISQKTRSTMFSHNGLVGVNGVSRRRCRFSQRLTIGVLWRRVIVRDRLDVKFHVDGLCRLGRETLKLQMSATATPLWTGIRP
jgi:hypothetical protein